jgi:hypothetical protein
VSVDAMTSLSASSSDFGWGDADDEEPTWAGLGSSALLIASSSVYVASVWLAHGLPPLPNLAMRLRQLRARASC